MVAKGKMLCSKYHLCGDYKLDTKCKHGAIHEEILGVCNYHFCRGVSDWVHCIVEEEGGEELYICDQGDSCNKGFCLHASRHYHQKACDDPTCSRREGAIVGCVPVDSLNKSEEKENKEKDRISFITRKQLEENPNFKKGSMEDLSVVDCELWVELLLSRSVTRATKEKVNSDIDDAIKYLEILRIKLVEEINGK